MRFMPRLLRTDEKDIRPLIGTRELGYRSVIEVPLSLTHYIDPNTFDGRPAALFSISILSVYLISLIFVSVIVVADREIELTKAWT